MGNYEIIKGSVDEIENTAVYDKKEKSKNQKKPVKKGIKKNGGRNKKNNVDDSEFQNHNVYPELNTQQLINLTVNSDQEKKIISNESNEEGIENFSLEKSSGVKVENAISTTPISKRLRTRVKAKKHQC